MISSTPAFLKKEIVHSIKGFPIELKKKYPVWINTDILDTLKISDSYKDIQRSLLVRKNFTGEASMPTVDLQWISF